MPSASKWPPPAMRGAKSASHITQSHLSAKNHTNLIDIPQTNYYQMILRIICSNAQVISLSRVGMVVLRTTFSYIRGSGSHISLENIVTVRYMYYRGAIIGTAKIELAGNKVLRNDLAAPHSGVVATWSSERPYFRSIVLRLINSPSNTKQ